MILEQLLRPSQMAPAREPSVLRPRSFVRPVNRTPHASNPGETPGCFPGVRAGPVPDHVRMSKEQPQLDAILRQGLFSGGGDVPCWQRLVSSWPRCRWLPISSGIVRP
jgi:hypothetical protein